MVRGKNNIANWILTIVIVTFPGCNTDEAEFPVVTTMEAQQIGTTSVVIEAEITETGSIRPIQFGFLWGATSGINIVNTLNKLDLGSTSEKRKFSVKLETLAPGTTYYVRSFVSDPDYTKFYYGNEIAFTTLP